MKHSRARDNELIALGAKVRLDQLSAEIRAAKAEQSDLLTRYPSLAGPSFPTGDEPDTAEPAHRQATPERAVREGWSDEQLAKFLKNNLERGRTLSADKQAWLNAYLAKQGANSRQLELPTAAAPAAEPEPAAAPAKKAKKAQKRGKRH